MASKEDLNRIWFKSQKRVQAKLGKRPTTSLGLRSQGHFTHVEQSVIPLNTPRRPATANPSKTRQQPKASGNWVKTKALHHAEKGSNVLSLQRNDSGHVKTPRNLKGVTTRYENISTKTVVKKQQNSSSDCEAPVQIKLNHNTDNSVGLQTKVSSLKKNLSERKNTEGVRFIEVESESDLNESSDAEENNSGDETSSRYKDSEGNGYGCSSRNLKREQRKERGHLRKKCNWNELLDNLVEEEGGYDTDIEIDFKEEATKQYDLTGKMLYMNLCKENDMVPVSYFLNRIEENALIMRHHGLGSVGAKLIASSLVKNTVVEVIDLRDNFLAPEGGIAFAEMLQENFFITELDLSDNFLHAQAGIAFAQVLLLNTALRKLVLQGNHFTDRVAKAFADVLKENRTLSHLDLSYNEFGEQGGLYFGAGLALNYGLEILNLSWNSIRGKGAVSIAAALRTNDSLKVLDVSWNGFGFVGALALSRHLRKNESLKELDISNNRMGPKSAVKLSPSVRLHPQLEVFKIGKNPIGDEGVEAILSSVKRNMTIKRLGLDDITVSPRIYQEILNLESSRDIIITTGGLGGFAQRKPPPSGMEILVQFMQDNRLRLKDWFFQFDKDHSGDITREEFKLGLIETGIKMSDRQLDALIESIDIDGNHLIDYREVLQGRDAILKERRFQKKVAIRTEQREKESIHLPKLAGFEE